MGQKILPISLRLKNNKNWHSQWIVDKNNYSEILHFDLEIRKYIEILFNKKKRSILQIKINKISKNIYIYIFIHNNFKRHLFLEKLKIISHLNNFLNNKYNIKIFILKTHLALNNYQKNLRIFIKHLKKKKKKKQKIIKIFEYMSNSFCFK